MSLNIYYDSFKYTAIEEIIKTELIDLVANLGGIFGLLIGMSVLSFVELFDLVFVLIEFWLKKKNVLSFENEKISK